MSGMTQNGTKADEIKDEIKEDKIDEDKIDVKIKEGKELFDSCRYNEAEQIFLKNKGSVAAAWRILCHIVHGDVGKKGGKVSTLLQESVRNQDATIVDTIEQLRILILDYGNAIDKKTKNKVMTLLNDVYNNIMREKLTVTISEINRRSLEIVKSKGYIPSIYDDKTIPLKVLNSKLKKHKYRIRHYKPEDITKALKIIDTEKFIQDVVDEYMSMAHSNIVHVEDCCLDTRNQDILRYIKSLYISNIAYEKELRYTKSIEKQQLIDTLNELSEKGLVRTTIFSTENTKYFNMSNKEEKNICEEEIELLSTASVVAILLHDGIIEKRGYMIHDEMVNQISKEDIAIGDVTDRYTKEYVGPVPGTIYYDN